MTIALATSYIVEQVTLNVNLENDSIRNGATSESTRIAFMNVYEL